MPGIPDSFLDDLLARTDFIDLVSGYVKLTQRGNTAKGLCPFHSERTPSFSVSADKQMYYCFGCNKGGGAINFIMEIENLPFHDAVAFLARRAGMTVPDSGETRESVSRRNRMLELNRDAARFYNDMLSKSGGAAALNYMRNRRISPKYAKIFGLGAAPNEWTALSDAMRAKGYTWNELYDAGLAKRGKSDKGGGYDTFRDRLMFPVIDVRGSVIGFSGRALGDDAAKYINSPDTAVYSKSRNLFALNLAKKSKAGRLILVEGNIDVVALHQAGIDCAVASLGTALTVEQAQLMKRFTENVVLCYDGDEAGQRASKRAIGILEPAGLDVRVLRLDGAKDPDEYIVKFGADAFLNLMDRSEAHIEYRLADILKQHDVTTSDGRIAYLKSAVELLAAVRSPAEREVYGRNVAETANVSYDTIEIELKRAFASRRRREAAKETREEQQPLRAMQPTQRSMRYSNEASASAEMGVLRCVMSDPETIKIARESGLSEDEFTAPWLGRAFSAVCAADDTGTRLSVPALTARFEPGEASELARVLTAPFDASEAHRAMRDYIEKIRDERVRHSGDIADALRAAKKNKQRKAQ
ncbi:MAG: DNA primase [Oscillospiraceae bacterium]|nr:DNA primase [Oscillospiraceae bacterium]